MEVILLERIHRLGGMGDTVKVKDGFARNFLLPQKKALRATESNKALFEAKRGEIEAQNAASRGEAEKKVAALEGVTVTLVRQASEEGKLFGSVTVRDISEGLKEQGFDVPKSQIVISGSIKTTGTYPVKLNLHADVTAIVQVSVVRNEIVEAA
ncbi:MAG: 50S ribosomal protein L9 [Alphaproteobacteria bacterium]|nr:50S ribosomal protein L9 [Alphaproteobacteria bacterium]